MGALYCYDLHHGSFYIIVRYIMGVLFYCDLYYRALYYYNLHHGSFYIFVRYIMGLLYIIVTYVTGALYYYDIYYWSYCIFDYRLKLQIWVVTQLRLTLSMELLSILKAK